jgi:hypothetical protein
VKTGAGLKHVLHRKLPCGLGKMLGRSPGSEDRRRGELGGGGPAAAAGTRAPAIVRLGLINKRLGELLGCIRAHELVGMRASTGRCAPAALMAERRWLGLMCVRARSGRGLAYKRGGGRLGVGGVTPVPLARVERPGAWPATCAAPAANGAPRAVHRPVDLRHLARPTCHERHGCAPTAQRSDQRSLRHLGVRARRGYGAYGEWPTWPRTTSRRSASRAFPGVCISLKQFSN